MATITGTFNSLVSGTLSGVVGTPGPRGLPGSQGPQGPAGATGAGVAAGGTTGQYLVKTSGLDFATGWQTLSLSGYLSLDGGEMNANAEITFEDTALGRVALASGSAFAVSSSSNPDLLSNLLYDRIFVKNATSQTTIKPTGVEFPDLTLQTSAGITAATAASTYYPLSGNPSGFLTSASLSGYATLSSPAFSGVPTAPSAALGTDSDQIATTAFVQDSIIAGSAHAETLQAAVRNETGATLAAFTVVYITGASGNKATVSKAQANAEGTSSGTFGILETAIPNNQNGVAITAGVISGQDTSAFAEGAQLWLSPTVAGGVTTTKPAAPNHAVFIGVVTRVHANQGTVEVRIANGFELQELHNVSITSVANGDLLAYESATSLWKNKSISTLDLATESWVTTELGAYLTTADAATNYAPLSKAVPAGGTTGQVLTKASDSDWSLVWAAGGGGGGIPDAPADNYVYGRMNESWIRIPGISPFTSIATNVSSIASWSVSGANAYLSGAGVVVLDTPATVTSISINGGGTSTTTINLSALSGLSGQLYLQNLISTTAEPVIPSAFNDLYFNNCGFNSVPALSGISSLQYVNFASCPNLTSIPDLYSGFMGNFAVNSCPITSLPALGSPYSVNIQSTALTSGPYLGSNSTLVTVSFAGNNSMVSGPSFANSTALLSGTVSSNSSMTGFPDFSTCTAMTYVQVANNPVMATPPSLVSCENLQGIEIYNNALMPTPSIPFSANLNSLRLYNNPSMTYVPSVGGYPTLNYIDISGCGISDLSVLNATGDSVYNNAQSYSIYYGYLNMSGGSNAYFDSSSLPGWISGLQSYGWSVVYNSY